jgi:hypothetical protein
MEGVGGGAGGHRRSGSEGGDVRFPGSEGGGGGHRRQSSAGSDGYSEQGGYNAPSASAPPQTTKKWVARPVWEEFVRLDAFDLEIDTAVDIKVMTDDGGRGGALHVGIKLTHNP